MKKFVQVVRECLSDQAAMVLMPVVDAKQLRIVEYLLSNVDKSVSNEVISQICSSPDDVDQFLLGNGYTHEDLAKMYKHLFYEI